MLGQRAAPERVRRREQPGHGHGHSHGHSHPTGARGHWPPSPLAPLPLLSPLPTLPSAHPSPSQPDFTGQLPLISEIPFPPPACQTNRQVHENLINLNATAGFSRRHLHLPAPAVLAGSASALPWHPGTPQPGTQHPRTQHPGTLARSHGRHCTKPLWAAKAAPEREGKGCKFCSALCSVTGVPGPRSPGSVGRGAVPWGWSRCRGHPRVGGSSRGRPGASVASSLVEPACDPGEGSFLSLLGPWEGIAGQLP